MLAGCAILSPPNRHPGSTQGELRVRSVIRRAEFAYEPIVLVTAADVPVRLTFDNHVDGPMSGGGVPHTFTIDAWPRVGWLTRILGHTVDIPVRANDEADGEFQLPPGSYEFYCTVFSHREAGMVGTLTVE